MNKLCYISKNYKALKLIIRNKNTKAFLFFVDIAYTL